MNDELPPKSQVEALLFASGRAMSVDLLAQLSKLSTDVVRRACKALAKDLDDRQSALMIYEMDGGWKMTPREAYSPLVKAIVAEAELSRACLETLAVIAYKHPNAVQSAVIDARGSGAYDHIAELERLGFIAKVPFSRSYKLKLTEKFFTYFDVKGGEDEIKRVFAHITIPEPKAPEVEAQRTLGDLDVVAVDPKKATHDVEIVDVPEGQNVPAPEEEQEVAAVDEGSSVNTPAHRAFLDDLDNRIAQLSKRNDDHAQDPMLQRRPLPGAEETPSEGLPQEAPVAEPAPEPVVEEKPKKRKKKSDPSS